MKVIVHITFFLSFIILSHTIHTPVLSVGVISGSDDDIRQNSREFWLMGSSSRAAIEPEVEDIKALGWKSPEVVRAVCLLLKTGVQAFVSSVPVRHYPVLQAYAQRFRIPLLTTHAPALQSNRSRLELTMTPDSSDAVGDLLSFYKWDSFVFFYDEDDGPQKLQKVLKKTNHRVSVDALWRISSKEEAIRYLQLLPPITDKTQFMLLATNENLADEILETLPFTTRIKYHLLLMNPAGLVREIHQYRPRGNYLLTKLSMVDINSPMFKVLENKWTSFQSYPRRNETDVIPFLALLWRDMQEVLYNGFVDFLGRVINFTKESIDCMELEFQSDTNTELFADHLKKVIVPMGITGNIQFSPSGERTNYTFNIFETTFVGNKKIGTWSPKAALNISVIGSEQNKSVSDKQVSALKQNITVVSVLSRPFFMLKGDSEERKGKDRYEGFVKDILDVVAKSLNWDYEIIFAKDRRYGSADGERSTGMVGVLVRREADVAVADLTITNSRKTVLDFSVPMMTIGLNILMKKPDGIDVSPSSIGMFGFMQVWSYQTWLLIALFYFILGGYTYGVSHVIGEPDRIRSLDTKLSDKLSLCSSFWFVLGSLVFRSTGIYPRSSSHRMLTIVWWAFSLVLLVVYISSLTVAIIGERTAGEEFYTRDSFEILRNAVEKGHPKLGIIRHGSTEQFFLTSQVGLYKDFGDYIKSNQREVSVSNYSQGLRRVIESKGDFGMITESSSSHHLSSIKPCQAIVSTGFLDHRSFGFAFKKGSGLREAVDQVLMNLIHDGVLRRLYEKWWHLRSECDDPYLNILPSLYSNSLTLKEASGLFCFLLIGMIAAAAAGVFEYVLQSKRLSVDK